MIRIVVADDHPVVRDGIRAVLDAVPDFEVVGEAPDGPAALDLVVALDPDIVVIDLRMPGGGGVEVVRELGRRGLRCAALVLTTFDTDADTVAAVEAGARGYLLKDASTATLHEAVRATAGGGTFLSPAIAARLASHVRAPQRSAALSSREREVLALVARGMTNGAIAQRLLVSEATVKTHLVHVYGKLGVSDRAAAVAIGYEKGILGGSAQ